MLQATPVRGMMIAKGGVQKRVLGLVVKKIWLSASSFADKICAKL